jgi:uncharacterized membrane protein
MKKTKIIILTLTAGFMAVPAMQAAEITLPAASTKENITYATDIKPIFDNSCVKCHSGNKAKAGLHLDSLAGVLKGAKQGKVLTPGNPENSQIVKSIGHLTKDKDAWMPPLHNKAGIKPLTSDEISLIIGWIKQGAK